MILSQIQEKHNLYELTLTTSANYNPEKALKKLYTGWDKLKRAKYFTDNVKGGSYTLHPDYDPIDGAWTVHLHCTLEADSLSKEKITALWQRHTGDFITSLQRVRDSEDDRTRLTIYQNQSPVKHLLYDRDVFATYKRAMGGRRAHSRFGSWRGWKAPKPRPRPTPAYPPLPTQAYDPIFDGPPDAHKPPTGDVHPQSGPSGPSDPTPPFQGTGKRKRFPMPHGIAGS